MCKFCDDIYPEDDSMNIIFGRGKYENVVEEYFESKEDKDD